jgi:hypothetical protein
MNSCYSFRTNLNQVDGRPVCLVIFCTRSSISKDEIKKILTLDVEKNLRPDEIVFVFRENIKDRILAELSAIVADEGMWRYSLENVAVSLVTFNKVGDLDGQEHLTGPENILSEGKFERLKLEGNYEIFRRRDCYITPSDSTHFVHPSGKHSQGFMKIANLSTVGAEVSFVGFCVLQFLNHDLDTIWVDTSTISNIAYAAIQLKMQFDFNYQAPIVSSFWSWEGLKSNDYPFSPSNSVVFISASTTGNMAADFGNRHQYGDDRLVTLFSRAQERKHGKVLCDLSTRPELAKLDEYEAGNCELCKNGSKTVQFVGDLFRAEDIKYEGVIPTRKDCPDELPRIMEEYNGKQLFRLGMADNRQAVHEVNVDIEKACKTKEFQDRLQDVTSQFAPASMSIAIATDDADSLIFARKLQEIMNPTKEIEIVSVSDKAPLLADLGNNAIGIFAGAIRSGGTLQSASRDLRDYAPTAPRVFVVGFAKHSHLLRHKILEGDLEFRETGKHTLRFVEKLILPSVPKASAWEDEKTLLLRHLDIFAPSLQSEEDDDFLRRRESEIDSLATGEINKLFWAFQDRELKIRETFAFWRAGYDKEKASQCDVFITIASVLENMRHGNNPKLHSSAFHQSLISPSTFGRYNDGIIQASILRTAQTRELDYSNAAEISAEFGKLLKKIFENWGNARGEATLEFLISIACRRLRLAAPDLQTALSGLADVAGPPELHFLKRACNELLPKSPTAS